MSEVRTGMIIAGKYRLEAELARGGMGSVWRAHHLALEADVAVKFIGSEVFALQEARKRFEREAKAAALLQSANVVQIHDYGVEGNIPYLVMELLIGEDLGVRLKREAQLSLSETVTIVTQVARALRRAADAGIVHRDLKPSNVFILRGDEDETLVKVLDFGVAKTRGLALGEDTKTGAIIGSPRYMSPEQARGSRLVDPRSDLWSLAVIAYRALTGELPFQSTDIADLIVKICSEPARPPSQLEPSLPPEMDAFFAHALRRDPADRFQTARELSFAFAVAAGEPPSSSQSSFHRLTRPPPTEPRVLGSPPAAPPSAPENPSPRGEAPAPPSAHRGPLVTPSSLGSGPPHVSARLASAPVPVIERPARESVTKVEPAASHPAPVLPDGTLTTSSAGNLEVSPLRKARSPPLRARPRRAAIGTGAAILLGGSLLLVSWSRSTPPPLAGTAVAPAEVPRGSTDEAPVPPPAPSTAPSATGRADAHPPDPKTPAPPSAEPPVQRPRRPPATPTRRKHPILGI